MASGDERETAFMFQRVSALVQRDNSVLLHDSFVREDARCPGRSLLHFSINFSQNPYADDLKNAESKCGSSSNLDSPLETGYGQ